MNINEFKIKKSKGRYGLLDKQYQKFLLNKLTILNDGGLENLELLNMFMIELCNLGEFNIFEEIKYRITDNEYFIDVILNMFEKIENKSDVSKNIISEIKEKNKLIEKF